MGRFREEIPWKDIQTERDGGEPYSAVSFCRFAIEKFFCLR